MVVQLGTTAMVHPACPARSARTARGWGLQCAQHAQPSPAHLPLGPRVPVSALAIQVTTPMEPPAQHAPTGLRMRCTRATAAARSSGLETVLHGASLGIILERSR